VSDRHLPVVDGVIASGDRPGDGAPGFGHSGTGARDVISKSGLRVVVAPEAGKVVDVYRSSDPERSANTDMCVTRRADGSCELGVKSALTQGFSNPWDGYGPGGVVIAGDSGAFHLLAHLATVTVAVGDRVALDEQVGTMPSHVGASRSHVHWEVRKRPITTSGADRVDGALSAEAWLAGGSDAAPEVPRDGGKKPQSSTGIGWLILAVILFRTK